MEKLSILMFSKMIQLMCKKEQKQINNKKYSQVKQHSSKN